MDFFRIYFNLGINHILNFDAYDHILFIATLVAIYQLKQWRQIIILVTAFTIGHATTLVLSTLRIININPNIIEVLIPITIIITALFNVLTKQDDISQINKRLYVEKYITSVFFGLIHGLGFAGYLRSMLDVADNITMPLFAFNIGIEAGQFIVVMVILSISYILLNKIKIKQRDWNLFLSGAGFGVAFILMIQRFIDL